MHQEHDRKQLAYEPQVRELRVHEVSPLAAQKIRNLLVEAGRRGDVVLQHQEPPTPLWRIRAVLQQKRDVVVLLGPPFPDIKKINTISKSLELSFRSDFQ